MLRDSLKAVRDSVRWAKPRVLYTSFVPDSLYYEEIFSWNADTYENRFKRVPVDTTFNEWYSEMPYFHSDIDVVSLGTVGSPTMSIDFHNRRIFDKFKGYEPYLYFSHTPDDMPFYNTKSPYTELAYWGTLFSYRDKEELNIRFLHTQNITPELNFSILVQRWSAAGILTNEKTTNNSVHLTGNYLGKNYVASGGYLHQNISRQENGGIRDLSMVRDTTVDAKTIPVHLSEANNKLSRNTLFIDHSYNISLKRKSRTVREDDTLAVTPEDSSANALFGRDTLLSDNIQGPKAGLPEGSDGGMFGGGAGRDVSGRTSGGMGQIGRGGTAGGRDNAPEPLDSAAIAEYRSLGQGPMLTIGHYGELTRYYRYYTDQIALTDQVGRDFYNNTFYINPVQSADSTRLFTLENRVYARLQPWTPDAVVSHITAGVGYQWNNIYSFDPQMFLSGRKNSYQNNFYFYASAGGIYRKYLQWDAMARYDFAGYYQNDLLIDGGVALSFYPFKDKSEPITLKGRFKQSLKEPDVFEQRLYSNHYVWNNDFSKVSQTRVDARVEIPKWKMNASFSYSLINNYIYYDTLGVVRQNSGMVNVMSASLQKDFKLWLFHLNHRLLFQYSSDKEVLPLPMFTFHFRYFIEFVAVKNALTIQIGADATFNTKYHAPAYNPALGVFQLQSRELYGNNPYIDVFVNLQWKTASIFLKVVNVAQGWPNGDMFSAHGYVRPYRTFKIGIHWPFHIR